MRLVVGLGNPGEEYVDTRHNAGFMFIDRVIDKLKERYKVRELSGEPFKSELYVVEDRAEKILLLAKPLTFMNLSGDPIKKIMEKMEADELILVHDDLDIALGEYKVQLQKSPKQHNGVLDVERTLGTTEFLRVRLGVDSRNNREIPGEDYVLIKMKEEEKVPLYQSIDMAIDELFEEHDLI
jgi:PTH1 family peptidyl-tRNA hydrolase